MPVISLQNGNGEGSVHYEFDPTQKPLGEGGMGRVFRGVQIDEGKGSVRTREVAIKLLFDDLPDHAIKRARREASVRIKSDNLVEMIDFVEDRDTITHTVHYHVVSEFLDGVNLDEMLEGQTTNHDGGRNPNAERLLKAYNGQRKAFVGEVFRSILSGIMALHDAGYIHRDIDPSNMMITSDGKIKLIDFGIAKKVNELGSNDKQLTSAGQFVGKTHYAAPELLLGDLKHQDRTTDIYSLGITLFQLMTGHLPFDGPFQEVYEKQLHEKLPLKEVDDKTLRKIIEKATEKDQKKRYQSASEFRVDIDRWMNEVPPPPRIPWKKIVIATVCLAAVVVAVRLWPDHPKERVVLIDENDTAKFYAKIIGQDTTEWWYEKKINPLDEISLNEAIKLLSDSSNGKKGLEMLQKLVENGDYEATFLMSRIYFDPSEVKEGLEFDKQWVSLRDKSGVTHSDKEAHNYLMKAWNDNRSTAEADVAFLYEFGCDFRYGRGTKKDYGKAHFCFKAADKLVDNTSPYKIYITHRLSELKDRDSIEP